MYLAGENSSWSAIRRKKNEHFKITNTWLQKIHGYRNIKGFSIICYPKTKKNQLLQKKSKLLLLQNHPEENARIGGSAELFLSSSDLKYCSTILSKERSTMKVYKTMKGIKRFAEQVLKSLSGRNNSLKSPAF